MTAARRFALSRELFDPQARVELVDEAADPLILEHAQRIRHREHGRVAGAVRAVEEFKKELASQDALDQECGPVPIGVQRQALGRGEELPEVLAIPVPTQRSSLRGADATRAPGALSKLLEGGGSFFGGAPLEDRAQEPGLQRFHRVLEPAQEVFGERVVQDSVQGDLGVRLKHGRGRAFQPGDGLANFGRRAVADEVGRALHLELGEPALRDPLKLREVSVPEVMVGGGSPQVPGVLAHSHGF